MVAHQLSNPRTTQFSRTHHLVSHAYSKICVATFFIFLPTQPTCLEVPLNPVPPPSRSPQTLPALKPPPCHLVTSPGSPAKAPGWLATCNCNCNQTQSICGSTCRLWPTYQLHFHPYLDLRMVDGRKMAPMSDSWGLATCTWVWAWDPAPLPNWYMGPCHFSTVVSGSNPRLCSCNNRISTSRQCCRCTDWC